MNKTVLTFDTDWCSDTMIQHVMDKLESLEIKSTWFITHDSPVIQSMKENKLVELGIHPNFHPNSTQGKDFDDIMKNLLQIVSDAKAVRTHTLLWSTRYMEKFKDYGIKYDSSLLLPYMLDIKPHYYNYYDLTRFPIYFEDDIAIQEKRFGVDLKSEGLKIFNFHPIHIYLNSIDISYYNKVKNSQSIETCKNNSGFGVERFFDLLIQNIPKSMFLSEVAE